MTNEDQHLEEVRAAARAEAAKAPPLTPDQVQRAARVLATPEAVGE